MRILEKSQGKDYGSETPGMRHSDIGHVASNLRLLSQWSIKRYTMRKMFISTISQVTFNDEADSIIKNFEKRSTALLHLLHAKRSS